MITDTGARQSASTGVQPRGMAQIGDAQEKKAKQELSTSSKPKVDFGPLLETSIPQNRDLALKEGKPAEAIENLLSVSAARRYIVGVEVPPFCPISFMRYTIA